MDAPSTPRTGHIARVTDFVANSPEFRKVATNFALSKFKGISCTAKGLLQIRHFCNIQQKLLEFRLYIVWF